MPGAYLILVFLQPLCLNWRRTADGHHGLLGIAGHMSQVAGPVKVDLTKPPPTRFPHHPTTLKQNLAGSDRCRPASPTSAFRSACPRFHSGCKAITKPLQIQASSLHNIHCLQAARHQNGSSRSKCRDKAYHVRLASVVQRPWTTGLRCLEVHARGNLDKLVVRCPFAHFVGILIRLLKAWPHATFRAKAPSYSNSYLCLARYEGMDPNSSHSITHSNRFHLLFHSFIPS